METLKVELMTAMETQKDSIVVIKNSTFRVSIAITSSVFNEVAQSGGPTAFTAALWASLITWEWDSTDRRNWNLVSAHDAVSPIVELVLISALSLQKSHQE
jgi:hypothetical protein